MASRAIDVSAKRHLRVVGEDERLPLSVRLRARLGGRMEIRERAKSPTVVLVLLSATGLLTAIGLVMVLSASSVSAFAQYGSSFLFFKRQAMYAVVGTGALLLTSHIRYRTWQRLWVPVMI